jgi:membrane protease YdiL (CAAX protease family)
MYPLFVFGSLGLTVALAWATYQSGRLLRAVPVRENLLLAPLENIVKAGLVLLCIGLGILSGASAAQLGWTLENGWRDVGLGLIAGLVTQLAANVITLWAIKVWGKEIYSPVVLRNIMPRTRAEWLLVPAALLLAVVLEELLFRSLLVGALSLTIPVAVLVIMTSGMGLWLSLLFIWSGGLLLPLTVHFVINFLQLLKAQDKKAWLDEYED